MACRSPRMVRGVLLGWLLVGGPALAQAPAPPQRPPDFADSLSGGPDFWAVGGLAGGSRLNLRAEPTAAGAVVARLGNGDILRNLGCRMLEAERWCRVERPDRSLQGWVAGRYLREGAAPPPAASGPEPRFDATGALPCAVIPGQTSRDCAFGVQRAAPGAASIRVTGNAGIVRYIYFDGGQPVRSDGPGPVTFERLNDLFLIRIGGERYEVPLAVVEGG